MAAVSPIQKTNAIDISTLPSSNPLTVRKADRRVCFSELPPKHVKKEHRKNPDGSDCRPGLCLCCAWACMVLFALFLVFVVIGATFLAMVRSQLPEIQLQRMTIFNLDLVPSPGSPKTALLSADVDLSIEVSMVHQMMKLSFGTITVNVRSERVNLGKTEIDGFSLKRKDVKVMKVRTSVTDYELDKDHGELLKDNLNSEKNETVVDVLMYTDVGFKLGMLEINGFPVVVECMNMEQSAVDLGRDPKCSFNLLASKTLTKALKSGY